MSSSKINLTIKTKKLAKAFGYLDKLFRFHLLYEFKSINSSKKSLSIKQYNNLDDICFDDIDRDYESKYYPISFSTKIIEFWHTFQEMDDINYNDLLLLLSYYTKIYMHKSSLYTLVSYRIEEKS